jgi:hypothetical protein
MRLWTVSTRGGAATRKLFQDAFPDMKPGHCSHGLPHSGECSECKADIERFGEDGWKLP